MIFAINLSYYILLYALVITVVTEVDTEVDTRATIRHTLTLTRVGANDYYSRVLRVNIR